MKKRLSHLIVATAVVTLSLPVLFAESLGDSHVAIRNSLQRIMSNLDHPAI